MSQKNLKIWLSIVFLSVFADQLSKVWASHNLNFAESIKIIPHVLNFRLLYNTGAAFSSFSGQTQVLTLISLVFSIFLIRYTYKNLSSWNKMQIFSLSFLLAGALGNLIDRALRGKVIDFIDLLILPGDFPIFNLADICINLAVFIFVYNWLSKKIKLLKN